MDQCQTGITFGKRAKGPYERRQIFPRFHGPHGQHVLAHPIGQQRAPGNCVARPIPRPVGIAGRPHARVDHPDPVRAGTKGCHHLLCDRTRVGMHPCPPPQGLPDQFGIGTGRGQAHLGEPQRGQVVNRHDRSRPPSWRDHEVGAVYDIGPANEELRGWEGPVRPRLAEGPGRHRPVVHGDPGRDLGGDGVPAPPAHGVGLHGEVGPFGKRLQSPRTKLPHSGPRPEQRRCIEGHAEADLSRGRSLAHRPRFAQFPP